MDGQYKMRDVDHQKDQYVRSLIDQIIGSAKVAYKTIGYEYQVHFLDAVTVDKTSEEPKNMSVAVLLQMKNKVSSTVVEPSKEVITTEKEAKESDKKDSEKKDSDKKNESKNDADKDKAKKDEDGSSDKASVKSDDIGDTEEGEGHNFYIIQSSRPSAEDIGAAKSLLQIVEFLAAEVIREAGGLSDLISAVDDIIKQRADRLTQLSNDAKSKVEQEKARRNAGVARR